MSDLLRLRIPKGWVVLDNKLYDTEPLTAGHSNSITNWDEGFVEDVLWIQESRINQDGHYEIPKLNHFNIDISWLPDCDIHGQYHATLSWCGEDGMIDIEKFKNRDRHEIRQKIEFWMSEIKLNNSLYKSKAGK
jgi:hypothetical protein